MLRTLRASSYLTLLTLSVLTLAVEGSPPVHAHTAGIYDGECPFATLAAFHGTPTMPRPLPSTSVDPVAGSAIPAQSERPPGSPAQHTDSRAPPAPLS